MKFRFAILFYIISLSAFAHADTLTFQVNYPTFVHPNRNDIVNESALHSFFERLLNLKSGENNKVNILHIGDSHIQPDYITAVMRTNLQKAFGNAGRGLIIPIKVANSNEAFNYKTSSNLPWNRKRLVYANDSSFVYGIGGHTIRTDNDSAYIKIKTFNYAPLNYAFTKFSVFHLSDSTAFTMLLTDTADTFLELLKTEVEIPNFSTAVLPSETNEVTLRLLKADTLQKQATIFGFLAENDSTGVLVHAVGVNGAEAFQFVQAKHFAEQAKVLSPDLIIISLGTNEAQRRPFDRALTEARLDSLIQILRTTKPGTAILLTTPPDSYYSRKYYNPSIASMHEIIVTYASNNNLAVWDLFSMAGGYKSCYQWKKYGYMRRDGVHFTRAGYELQGSLLYQAFVNAFNQYATSRSK